MKRKMDLNVGWIGIMNNIFVIGGVFLLIAAVNVFVRLIKYIDTFQSKELQLIAMFGLVAIYFLGVFNIPTKFVFYWNGMIWNTPQDHCCCDCCHNNN